MYCGGGREGRRNGRDVLMKERERERERERENGFDGYVKCKVPL